jgi:phosphoribosyl 1,2-cyclic phosphodiesterase
MMSGSVGKIDPYLFHIIRPDEEFTIGDLTVRPIHISHDAADPVAYILKDGQKKMGVITDLGYYDDYIIENISDLDAMLIEANHDVHMLQVGPYPYHLKRRILGEHGHLSNVSSGQLLSRVLNDHMDGIFLGHLSKENNFPELAFETVRVEIMSSDTDYRPEDLPIRVAKRTEPSGVVEIRSHAV